MVKLCLVGEPAVVVEDERFGISPRASFELLALIVARYPASISRTDCTDLLFKHIEEVASPAAARQQFRIALSKLRRTLAETNLDEQFLLEGEDLRLTTPWEIDARQPVLATSLQELKLHFQPVAPHWDAQRWLSLREEYADRLARRLLELFDGQRARMRPKSASVREFRELGTLGSDLFPLEPGFARLMISLAEVEGNPDRAATLHAEFASRWTSQFPTAQVPVSLEPAAASRSSSPRKLAVGLVASLSSIMLVGAMYARGRSTPDQTPLSIEQLATERLEIDRRNYTLRKYRRPSADPPILLSAGDRTDGKGLLLLTSAAKEWVTDLDGKPVRSVEPWQYDFGQVRIRPLGGVNEGWALATNPNVKFAPTPDYSRVNMPTHVSGGLFFAYRVCTHSYGCHYDCIYLRDGRFVPFEVDGVKPQTVMFMFADKNHAYGMYSLGRKDGWRYHPFITDRTTLATRIGGEPFAFGRFSDGTWVCSPRVTRVVRGDYVLQETKEVVLVRPDGVRTTLRRNAKWANVVGDIVAVGIDEPTSNNFYTHVEFYDRFGNPIPRLNTIGSRVTHMLADPERRHLAFIPFENATDTRGGYLLSAEGIATPVTSDP